MIKTVFLCSIFVFYLSLVIEAQTPKSIEVKPGISLNKLIWDLEDKDYTPDKHYHPGRYVGVNAEFIHHKFFSILAEGGFTMKSYSHGGEDNPSFDYIYLSPIFKARKEFGKFIPYIFAGPRIDFLLTPESEPDYYYKKEEMNKVFIGFIYGLGLEYKFSSYGVALGFHQQIDFDNNPTQNTFIIFLGFKVYLKKKDKLK
jgi:hypothetical protein